MTESRKRNCPGCGGSWTLIEPERCPDCGTLGVPEKRNGPIRDASWTKLLNAIRTASDMGYPFAYGWLRSAIGSQGATVDSIRDALEQCESAMRVAEIGSSPRLGPVPPRCIGVPGQYGCPCASDGPDRMCLVCRDIAGQLEKEANA